MIMSGIVYTAGPWAVWRLGSNAGYGVWDERDFDDSEPDDLAEIDDQSGPEFFSTCYEDARRFAVQQYANEIWILMHSLDDDGRRQIEILCG